ncbi:hypothetical protein [Paraburkholderia aromaticivorans]|uniref:hypothetical protein n=1 Tax=Paraburkholderia aromaticivorans TaxID=2026199 RepID=UPI00142E492B|nr:hypothetical protein [Paraburkholderia aromaticivorans]
MTVVTPEAPKFTLKIRGDVCWPRSFNTYSSPIEKSKEVCRDYQIAIPDLHTVSLAYQTPLEFAEQQLVLCLLMGHGAPPQAVGRTSSMAPSR